MSIFSIASSELYLIWRQFPPRFCLSAPIVATENQRNFNSTSTFVEVFTEFLHFGHPGRRMRLRQPYYYHGQYFTIICIAGKVQRLLMLG